MVQFIREKTRQYAADKSSAIETGQLVQNIGEWNQAVQGAAKVYSAYNKEFVEQPLKELEEADTNMINTQIGAKAQTELLKWNVAQIEAGVDPNSDEYTQKLYAKKDELYQPYMEKMGSEKGRAFLEKQGLDTAEKIRQSNIGKISKNRQKAQAQYAYIDVRNNMKNDAREFGKLGDWEGFKEAVEEDRKALIKYGKANNIQGGSEFEIDKDNIENYLLGLAESDPEAVINMFDDQETLKKITYEKLASKDPTLTDKQKEKIYKTIYEETGQKADRESQFSDVLPESIMNQTRDAFVKYKKDEQLYLREQMKDVPKDSKAYKSFEKRYNEAQEQIDNPDESVIGLLRKELGKSVLPIAREQLGKNRLQQQKMEEDNVKGIYTMVLNPDTSVSLQAQMALSLGQPAVENLFQQSISDEEMHKAYDAYAQAKTDVLTRQYATFEATRSVSDKVYDFLQNSSDNDIVLMKDGLELLTEMHKADLTQGQWEDLNNIMYGVFKDRAFGDMVSSVLEDNNRYFPDLPLVFSLGSQSIAPQSAPEEAGLPSNVLYKSTLGSVRTYLDKESTRISKDAMTMLGQVAQLPTAEQRAEGVNQVQNYVASEKKKVYDNAMKSYGIDLAKLRENKRNFGQAFTQLGSRNTVEYMGDDPYSGEPLFRPLTDYTAISNARKRILEGLDSSKKSSEEKEK